MGAMPLAAESDLVQVRRGLPSRLSMSRAAYVLSEPYSNRAESLARRLAHSGREAEHYDDAQGVFTCAFPATVNLQTETDRPDHIRAAARLLEDS